MKKLFFAASLFVLAATGVKAQKGFELGMNLGPTIGVDAKITLEGAHALEGILGYNVMHDGPSFKFLYNYNINLVDELCLYMGGGLQIGGFHVGKHRDGDFSFGLVPTIGLDYKFRGAPLAFGFGYEPIINFTSCHTWSDFAFKVRYRF